ncbi:MAG TPA: diaminopimelate epimerase [Bryobacteraceae bacterium]|nr:diaminopimelate epimerase [Bryobacteraceae bacterium]
MRIPFTKAHGSKNDFLLTWADAVPAGNLAALARAICERHTGVGADGWMLVSRPSAADADAAITLFNSDGSGAEMSGNGTRCAAAFLILNGFAGDQVRIRTGAGIKRLQLITRQANAFVFDMNMGQPQYRDADICARIQARSREFDAMILHVGTPQCALITPEFPQDWREIGAEIENHPRFPNRTNVSFIRPLDDHSVEALFWERGAGETMSSGTGSTGAAVAALARGLVRNPVRVLTPAGPLEIRIESDGVHLVGPAEIVAAGEFFSGNTT